MPTTYEPGITVCIPVGPFPANQKWLEEALSSVRVQTLLPDQIILINDGANPDYPGYAPSSRYANWGFTTPTVVDVYTPPWHVGVGAAFNFGVALAKTECVFMLGSDDTLEPTCLEQCALAYEIMGRQDGYYYVPVKYMSDGRIQNEPCNAAMVTKGLWKKTGGFPVEASTAPDAALISIMMVHMPDGLIHIIPAGTKWLYGYRDHQDTDTKQHGAWHASNVIVETRNLLTKEWTPPEWAERFS